MTTDNDDQPTCGKGIAASAPLPDAVADVLRGMSALFQNHIRALNSAARSDQPEIDAYGRLARNYGAGADNVAALAELMRSYRTLPMATHDMAVLTDKTSFRVFAELVAREQALLTLLQEQVAEHTEMLNAMRGE